MSARIGTTPGLARSAVSYATRTASARRQAEEGSAPSSGERLADAWPEVLGPGVHVEKHDELEVLWAALPPPVTGVLLFRVGRVDETLATAGITHLAEHLAFESIGEPECEANAMVDPLFTAFHASGDLDEVLGFLVGICHSLRRLDFSRLATERRILRTESETEQQYRFFDFQLRSFRFGAVSHGLPGFPELGLDRLDERDVSEWVDARCTADNAILILTAQPPSDLRLELPRGTWYPPPTPAPLEEARGRRWSARPQPSIAFSAVMARSAATSTAVRVIDQRLVQVLRRERGLVYDVSGSYESLDGETSHLAMGLEGAPGELTQAKDALFVALRRLATEPPTERELTAANRGVKRVLESPVTDIPELDFWARDRLLGRAPVGRATLRADFDALSPDDVRAVAEHILDEAFLVIPDGVAPPEDFEAYEPAPRARISGRRFRPRLWWLPVLRRAPLLVGDAGLTILEPGREFTVPFRECVALEIHSDGSRGVWRTDGEYVGFHPHGWVAGAEAVRLIDRAVPAHLHIPVDCNEERKWQGDGAPHGLPGGDERVR